MINYYNVLSLYRSTVVLKYSSREAWQFAGNDI